MTKNSMDDYYQNCAFPKPKPTKKKRPLENGYKDKANRRCWYTGKPGAERHEVFPGIRRQASIAEGFQVDVCPEIHQQLQANGTEWARIENRKWRMYYQQQYEEKLIASGIRQDQAREIWMQMMGENYL